MRLPDRRPSRHLLYLMIIASLAIWAGTSVIGKVTVGHFPVFTTVFLRFCIASLCLLPFFLRDRNRPRIAIKDWWQLLGLALIGFTGQIGLFFVGIAQASVLDASVIVALGPMMISLAGWVFLKEKFRIYNLLGMSLASFGAILALTWAATSTHHSLWGNLAILGSELAAVLYTIWSKEILLRYSALTITTISFIVAMISFAPLAAWEYATNPTSFAFSTDAVWGILYLGILSSVVAYLGYEWALGYVNATTVGALSYLQPLGSIALAMLFLHELPNWGYVLGGVITVMGIILALNQPHFKQKTAKETLHTRHMHRRT